MHIRPVKLALAALLTAFAVACGGSDDKSSPLNPGGSSGGNTWDVSKADDLTHAALLVTGDLPGSGWTSEDDDFEDDDKVMPSACSDFEGFKKDARTAAVSRAKRSLERPGASRDDFGTEVETTINVYKDAKTASDLVNRYKGIIGSDKFISCFEATIKEDTSRDAKVAIKKVATSGNAPSGGAGTALDVDVSLGRDQLLAQSENYVWTSGNAVIQLNVTATKKSFDAGLIKTAISKQEDAVKSALAGTRQRTAGPTPTPVRSNATPSPTARAGTPAAGTATPTRGATGGLTKLGLLEDTSSHRYVIKIEETGIDFFELQDLASGVQALTGGQAPRAGAPLSLEVTGSYVKPDKAQVKIVINSASIGLTTIGTQQWTQVGTTTSGPKSVGRQSPGDLSLAIEMLGSFNDESLLKLLKCSGNSTVNGVAVRQCSFSKDTLPANDLQQFVESFVDETGVNVDVNARDVTKLSFDVWAGTQGDYPIKTLFEFAGKDTKGTTFSMRMESNVTDINRPIDIATPR